MENGCSNCGKMLVRRIGYHISMDGLKDGKCRYCFFQAIFSCVERCFPS